MKRRAGRYWPGTRPESWWLSEPEVPGELRRRPEPPDYALVVGVLEAEPEAEAAMADFDARRREHNRGHEDWLLRHGTGADAAAINGWRDRRAIRAERRT